MSNSVSDTPDTPSRNTNRCRAWCFTWNNYTSSDVKYLLEKLSRDKYLFGEETGTAGTPHLQGVVRFTNARSFEQCRKIFKNNHIEKCSNWSASLNYCSKDGQTYTNIASKLSRHGRLLKLYDNVVWKPWQKQIIDIVDTEPNNRTVNWFWESNGNVGKSFLAKYLYLKYGAIIADGKKDNVFNQVKNWLDTHKQEEDIRLVLLDIPRYNIGYENYGVLEKLKDGMMYSGKYEGGVCAFLPPHVVVFANTPPNTEHFSEDRWNVVCIDQSSA